MTSANLLLLVAVLPPILLIAYVYSSDKIEKEPISLLFRLVLFGMGSILPAILLEMALEFLLKFLFPEGSTFYNLLDCFLIIALAEEGVKYFILKKRMWDHPRFNYRFDAIVYAVCIGLGFALAENIMYVLAGGLTTGLIRAVTAIPAHAINAVFSGYYFGQAKRAQHMGHEETSRFFLKFALILPIILHGFYDFCAVESTPFFQKTFIAFVVLMDLLALHRIHKSSKEDSPV